MIDFTFKPIYNKNSKILILGSFPSVKSREYNFYYSNPQNRFWKMLSLIYKDNLPETIDQKKNLILDHNLALYDAIKMCDIKASSDLSIRNEISTDIDPIIENSNIQKILCNGKKSFDIVTKKMNKKAIQMPSTSSANARYSLKDLVEIWGKELL